MKPQYPKEVGIALDRLTAAGFSAYIVGGALRDALLGRTAHDWDIATSALPKETEALFPDLPLIKTGMKHGTVTALINHMPIEITTFRIDGEYHDARHPDQVQFTDRITEDLSRRDFTVNAMAYHETTGLVDTFGGQKDLEGRIIRAVGDAATRFSEDALRILRAFRFQSKLDFDIHEDTLKAAADQRMGLCQVSSERITAELCGIFEGMAPCRAITSLLACGIFEAIAPTWCPSREGLPQIEALPPVFELRFAAFLRPSKDGGEGLLRQLRLPTRSVTRIRSLIALTQSPIGTDECGVRHLLARAGAYADDVEPLVEAGFFSLSENDRRAVVSAIRAVRARGDCLSVSTLAVKGNDLTAMGLSGKQIGEILDLLLLQVLDDPAKNQKEHLLDLAAQNLSL